MESQQWRAEGADPAQPGVPVNPEVPRGRAVWRHWTELKRQVNNEINSVLKDYIISQSSALGRTFSIHLGSNWEEVITEVRAGYWKKKVNPKPGKKMEDGWTTPAFEVWLAWGEPVAKDGKVCHPALALEAAARKKGQDEVTAGRNFLRHQSKKVKSAAAAGNPGGAPGATVEVMSLSPATKVMLEEIKGVRHAMESYNRRQDIAMALQFCKDPAMQAALMQSVLGLPGVQTLMGGPGQGTPASDGSSVDVGAGSQSLMGVRGQSTPASNTGPSADEGGDSIDDTSL